MMSSLYFIYTIEGKVIYRDLRECTQDCRYEKSEKELEDPLKEMCWGTKFRWISASL